MLSALSRPQRLLVEVDAIANMCHKFATLAILSPPQLQAISTNATLSVHKSGSFLPQSDSFHLSRRATHFIPLNPSHISIPVTHTFFFVLHPIFFCRLDGTESVRVHYLWSTKLLFSSVSSVPATFRWHKAKPVWLVCGSLAKKLFRWQQLFDPARFMQDTCCLRRATTRFLSVSFSRALLKPSISNRHLIPFPCRSFPPFFLNIYSGFIFWTFFAGTLC